MRHLLLVVGIALVAVPGKTFAQSETRLPDSEITLSGNAAVDRFMKQPAKPVQKLSVNGNTDAVHLNSLFTFLQKKQITDSLFLDGLAVKQVPASIQNSGVKHISIARCDSIDLNDACRKFAETESLNSIAVTVSYLGQFPVSLSKLRHLEQIKIVNTDLSLADGYALNYNLPGALYAEQQTVFGFTDAQQGASQLALVYGSYDAGFTAQHLQQLSDFLQGVSGTTAQLAQRKSRNLFIYRHPLVKKPIAGVDVASSFYTFRAENGLSFSYPSGSRIFIPKNAFVDASGKMVTGDVTVSYREFRDATDIIVSGIPMKYDSAGQTIDFESAGMFELAASAGSQEVFVAPGKNIDMQFAVTKTESSYNFYRLDEEKGWQYRGKPGAMVTTIPGRNSIAQSNNTGSAAIEIYLSAMRGQYNPGSPDTTKFQQRFESMRYLNTRFIGDRDSNSSELKGARYLKLRRVSGSKNYTCFKILPTNYQRFPELRAYKDIIWMMDEKLSAPEFRKRYGRKVSFNDVQVIGQNGRYTLKLKNQHGFTEVPVSAFTIRNGKLHKPSMAELQMKDFRYNTNRELREKTFNRKLQGEMKEHNKLVKNLGLLALRTWKNVKPQMTEAEKTLDFSQWKEAVDKYVADTKLRQFQYGTANSEGAMNVTRALSLNGTGIFNCDQASRVVNPAKVLAVGKNILGKIIPAITAYVITKGKNMALGFGAIDVNKGIMLNFSLTDSSRIVLIDEQGYVAVVESNELNKHQSYTHEARYEFTVKELGKAPPVAELKQVLKWE
jgi:hypothetical protein